MPPHRKTLAARRIAAVVVLIAALATAFVLVWQAGLLTGGGGGQQAGAAAEDSSAATATTNPETATPLPGKRRYKICAWSRGSNPSLKRAIAAGAVDEVDFDWYHSLAGGGLRAQGENMKLVGLAHAAGVEAYATITNRQSHTSPFDGAIAAAILAAPASRSSHVNKLVRLCTSKGFDGIDMDWEELRAADRVRFSAFLRELARKLHARGKRLSIAVYPKAAEPGLYDAQKAEDYRAIGRIVDEMKVMTYAFSGSWSSPGPQMPLYWARQVLDFAESTAPSGKVYMGMPFFGFDWKGKSAQFVLWKDVAAAKARYGGRLTRDARSGEAILRYTDGSGAAHVVYYQDRVALRTKLAWMKRMEPGIAGIAIWVMGGEDPGFWPVMARQLSRP